VIIHPLDAVHKTLAVLQHLNAVLMDKLHPFGIWGLGALAFIDAAFFPLPTTMNGLVIDYVAKDRGMLLGYCLMAAGASALGSMVPYYVGRAGGEVFLLKRINRERYEKMRDRFERQEFLAIMIPAMLPPPTPIKLFEFGAGVFEMKPLPFGLAIFTGKLIQFLLWSLGFIFFGPGLVRAVGRMVRNHSDAVLAIGLAAAVVLVVYIMRKVLDRRRRITPTDGVPEQSTLAEGAEDDDATLIS
jgi:membrane protein YqaA with SNARE-associated domain